MSLHLPLHRILALFLSRLSSTHNHNGHCEAHPPPTEPSLHSAVLTPALTRLLPVNMHNQVDSICGHAHPSSLLVSPVHCTALWSAVLYCKPNEVTDTIHA